MQIIYTYVYTHTHNLCMTSGLTICYWINNFGQKQEPMCWKFWDNPNQQLKREFFMPGVRIFVQQSVDLGGSAVSSDGNFSFKYKYIYTCVYTHIMYMYEINIYFFI